MGTWMKSAGVAGIGLLVAAAAASGQNQWLVEVTYSDPAGVLNSLDDTATVTLWAAFDPQYYAFWPGDLDVIAVDPLDFGLWSEPEAILFGPGAFHGAINGERVDNVITTQLHFPSGQIFADTSNPIAAWTAIWRTVDLSSRSVPVTTESLRYGVYSDDNGNAEDIVGTLEEGLGAIHVIPGPSASLLLAGAIGKGCARRKAR